MAYVIPIFLIIVLIFGPSIITSRLEKRKIWPYTALATDRLAEVFAHPQRYAPQMIQGAGDQGFEYLGTANDAKGKRYKVDYHFLVSTDNSTLAIIGAGTIIGLPLQGTWLYSRGQEGQCFYTVDHQNCVEKDLAGFWKDQLIFDADFSRLYAEHAQWAGPLGIKEGAYANGNELEEHRQAIQDKIERLEALGYTRFIDGERQVYTYTLKGAVKKAFIEIIRGLVRHLKAGKF